MRFSVGASLGPVRVSQRIGAPKMSRRSAPKQTGPSEPPSAGVALASMAGPGYVIFVYWLVAAGHPQAATVALIAPVIALVLALPVWWLIALPVWRLIGAPVWRHLNRCTDHPAGGCERCSVELNRGAR